MKNNIRINVIINIIRTVVLTFLSFITFPWVCRYLGETQLGTYTWANTFVQYFLIIAKVGIPNLAVRECVKVRDDKEKLSNRVQTFFLIQLVTTTISFGLMCILVFSVKQFADISSLIFILSLNFLTGAFSFEWVFIALEKQFYMSVRSIVVLALSSILIIVFVTSPSHLLLYALIAVSVTIVTTICNAYYVRHFVSFKKTMPYEIKQYVKPLLVLFTLTMLISLYNQTDTFILGFIDESKIEVASYSVGIKGIDIIIGIITALSTVFIPRAAYYYSKEDKRFFNNLTKYSMNICLFIVLPAIVTMAALAKPVCGIISGTNYAGESLTYKSAPTILITLSAMMLTYSMGDIIYGQVLLPMKKEKYYMICMAGGSLLNILLSIILGKFVFKESPAIGVAIGTVGTDLLMIIVLFALTWKWTKNALFNKNTLKLFISTLLILGITLLIKNPIQNLLAKATNSSDAVYLIQICSIIVIDAVIYIASLAILKEDLVSSLFRKKQIEENN